MLIGAGALAATAAGGYFGWRMATGSMAAFSQYASQIRQLPKPDGPVVDLVRAATLAANSHNTQPWQFRVGEQGIDIRPDFGRRTPAVDPDDHHLFVTLGCAAANMAVAGAASGRPGEVATLPEGGLRYAFTRGDPRPDPLFEAIAARQSTRAEYDGRPVPAEDLKALADAAAMDGVALHLVTERAAIRQVRDLVVASNDAQMHDKAYLTELKRWLRFNPRAAIATGDGLFSATTGNPVIPDWIGGQAFDLFFSAAAESAKAARQVDSSAGLAVFVGDAADPAHWMKVGMACQRFALAATSRGLRLAFVNQPVEVAAFRPALADLVGDPGKRPDLVIRFGYGPLMPYSVRRPVEAVVA